MNFKPIIHEKSGKPPNYVGWDTPEKKQQRLIHHLAHLHELLKSQLT